MRLKNRKKTTTAREGAQLTWVGKGGSKSVGWGGWIDCGGHSGVLSHNSLQGGEKKKRLESPLPISNSMNGIAIKKGEGETESLGKKKKRVS